MRRIVFVLFWLIAVGRLAWGDGEPVLYDPNAGVILPAEPTQAQVERERLEVEFLPVESAPNAVRSVKVRAQYWLRNPTDKPLKLQIGFPVPSNAVQLMEPPVRLDGQQLEWRLLEYEELLKPLRPALVRAVKRWAKQHPRAAQLAGEIRELERRRTPYREREERLKTLRQQLRSELAKAGGATRRLRSDWLYSSVAPPAPDESIWRLRSALLLTGQRQLLPEGRWHVDQTVLDPATGKQVWPREGYEDEGTVRMLIFPLNLKPNGRHHLKVAYQQLPSRDYYEEEALYHFGYILKTVGAWASFGPIECAVKAPAGLIFRSLPRLAYAGMSGGLKAYRGVIVAPRRNLQVVLGSQEMLWPRLKVNGHPARHWDMMVGETPVIPLRALVGYVRPLGEKRMERREVVLTRESVTLRVRPGEKQMLVNGQPVPLPVPVVVRHGNAYLPREALQALYPDCQVTVSYHAPSRTVLVGIRPKAPAPPAAGPG
jgi:hypothetical protein